MCGVNSKNYSLLILIKDLNNFQLVFLPVGISSFWWGKNSGGVRQDGARLRQEDRCGAYCSYSHHCSLIYSYSIPFLFGPQEEDQNGRLSSFQARKFKKLNKSSAHSITYSLINNILTGLLTQNWSCINLMLHWEN